ncbi:uncharacterized protein LOC134601419 isoform X2 [Pelobates fuscus]|uniref:uncharacterized protein LOC134601419 isoform X2 n=1 Tax=Pelobates fuscus TaxID=191477 RepID=UPI002FE48AB1
MAPGDTNTTTAILLLLLILPLRATAQVNTKTIEKKDGEDVTFQAEYNGPLTDIGWKVGENKYVDLDKESQHFFRKDLEARTNVSFDNRTLTLKHLVVSDSGDYSVNVLDSGKSFETKFFLKVAPATPKVGIDPTRPNVTLHCDSTTKNVLYEWFNSTGTGRVPLISTANYTAPIKLFKTNDSYTCVVSINSYESEASLVIGDLPKELELHTRNRYWILAPLFVCIILAVLFFILRKPQGI